MAAAGSVMVDEKDQKEVRKDGCSPGADGWSEGTISERLFPGPGRGSLLEPSSVSRILELSPGTAKTLELTERGPGPQAAEDSSQHHSPSPGGTLQRDRGTGRGRKGQAS